MAFLRPLNEIIKTVIRRMKERPTVTTHDDVLYTTGPDAVTETVFPGKMEDTTLLSGVRLAYKPQADKFINHHARGGWRHQLQPVYNYNNAWSNSKSWSSNAWSNSAVAAATLGPCELEQGKQCENEQGAVNFKQAKTVEDCTKACKIATGIHNNNSEVTSAGCCEFQVDHKRCFFVPNPNMTRVAGDTLRYGSICGACTLHVSAACASEVRHLRHHPDISPFEPTFSVLWG